MEVVGVVLGAVALLDPIYHGLRSLWSAYQIGRTFGEDFEISMTGLRSQEWIFASRLQSYETQYKLRGSAALHGSGQGLLKQRIADQITATVKVLNQCYEIVKKYDNEYDSAAIRRYPPPPAAIPGNPQAEIGIPFVARTPNKLRKMPSKASITDGVINYLKREAERKKARDEMRRAEELRGQPSETTQAVSYSQTSLVFNPEAQKGIVGTSAEASLAAHKTRIDERVKQAQKRAEFIQLVRWADHGKEEFDGLVSRLKYMNDVLREILPIAAQLDDPFRKIRPSANPSALWEQTENIRAELDNLHIAIHNINTAIPEEDVAPLQLAVKLEEDFGEMRRMADNDGLLTGLMLRAQPMLFCLMQKADVPDPLEREFMLSTMVCRASNEIDNLPRRIKTLRNTDADFNEVGSVTHGVQDKRIYHLQRILSEDLIGGHLVSSLVEDVRLRPRERICLAAQIAKSQLHFIGINPGKPHGPLSKYQLFGQEAPTDPDASWEPELLRSLWLEFGFGTAPTRKKMVLRATAKHRQETIDAAVELGVLIHQVCAGKLLQYESTVAGLDVARQEAQEALKTLESVCGLYTREIVETCFSGQPGDVDEQKKIIAEVTSALVYHAGQLKRTQEK